MKHLKIAGPCLVAVFAVSMVVSATASATWEHCTKGAVAGLTKWTDHNCSTASGTGEWQWKAINNTEEVRGKGSVRLSDTKVPIVGTVSVECSGEGTGFVGPGQVGRITMVEVGSAQCRPLTNCEKVEAVEVVHLPWQTEAYNTEGKHFGNLTGTGNGSPGWNVRCKVLGIVKSDQCVLEEGAGKTPESILLENRATVVGSETQLLVVGTPQHLQKQKCEVGGEKSGEISGSLAILQANGWGLRLS